MFLNDGKVASSLITKAFLKNKGEGRNTGLTMTHITFTSHMYISMA